LKRRLLAPAAAAVALLLAAPPPVARADDWPAVHKRGRLRVLAVLDARRPEFFADKPGAPGFDREVLDGFARLHHLTLEVVPVSSWDGLMPALLAGKGDVIAGRFTATATRRKLVAFTHEVFPTRNVVLTRKPAARITSLAELRKAKVGTIKGTSMAEAIAAAGVPAANVDDGLPPGGFGEALRSGRVTAAVWGVESAIALQREDPEIELGLFLGPPGSLAYATRPGDKELVRKLDGYIDRLRQTPTWNLLVVKYFGRSAPQVLRQAREQ
jgi:ABC-type amino acid transport substrate-binding protein